MDTSSSTKQTTQARREACTAPSAPTRGASQYGWSLSAASTLTCCLCVALSFTACGGGDDGGGGTPPGVPPTAQLVKDINPGAGSSSPESFVAGSLFFVANDGTTGRELWKSDGTLAGTVLVKDLNPAGDSFPNVLTNVNGTLFFRADDGTHGVELWKFD